MTNADKIRAMTDEELAIMIDGHYFLIGCPAGEFYKHKCHMHESCYHCWLDRLKQEVPDNG